MKASELTEELVRQYARIPQGAEDVPAVLLLEAAKSYVRGQTGLTDEEMDEHSDITIALLVLCADMYDNRQTTTDNDKPNRVVDSILSCYRRNFL